MDKGASLRDRAAQSNPQAVSSKASIPSAVLLGQSDIPASISNRDKCIAWALGMARVYMERGPGWRLWRVITDPIRANTLVVYARGLITAQPEIDDAMFRLAQGMEARSGETGTGSTEGNSPVGNADAPNDSTGA